MQLFRFEVDPGEDFKSLSQSQREQILSEWQMHQMQSTVPRAQGRICFYLYYVMLPIGIYYCCTWGWSLRRLAIGLVCVLIPVVWFLFPAIMHPFSLRAFLRSRARELALQQRSGTEE